MSENNSELISVIMPFYNAGEFLTSAVDSILNQSYTNLEFIIINDGSTDGSDKLIDNFSDNRIRYYSVEHKGRVAQLNFGINISKGKLIARMDADDISLPTRLEEEYNFLKNNPEISAVGTSYYRFDNTGKVLFTKIQQSSYENCKFIAPINSPILHPTLLTYREVLMELGGYKVKYEVIDDYDLFNRMIRAGYKISNIEKILFKYRINSAHSDSDVSRLQQKSIYEYGKESRTEEIKLSALNPIPHFQMAILEYYLGKISISRKYLFKTLKLKPSLFSRTLRYLPLTLLGNKMVNYLRRKKILYNISVFIKSKLLIDTNKLGY